MESRSSSCSYALDDGPDFLEFAVNQMSVDDESEFMFPIWPEKQSDDSFGNDKTGKEFQRLEMKAKSNTGAIQQHDHNGEGKNAAIMNNRLAIPGSNEQRRRSDIDDEIHREFSRTGKTFKSDHDARKTPPSRGMSLKVTKSPAAQWKTQPFMASQGMKVGALFDRSKNSLVRNEYWPLLRNLPYEKEKYLEQRNKKKVGLYDIATNLYALKKSNKEATGMHSLETKTNLSLAQRRGSAWLQNNLCTNKTQLPPMDSAQMRRYSEEWLPEKSVPSHYRTDVWKDSWQRSARRQSAKDSNGVVLKSVLQTLETAHLSGPSRYEVLKHSLPSGARSKDQATFGEKALPLVKSALAFKRRDNKLA